MTLIIVNEVFNSFFCTLNQKIEYHGNYKTIFEDKANL